MPAPLSPAGYTACQVHDDTGPGADASPVWKRGRRGILMEVHLSEEPRRGPFGSSLLPGTRELDGPPDEFEYLMPAVREQICPAQPVDYAPWHCQLNPCRCRQQT
jgi:hypothetical protein